MLAEQIQVAHKELLQQGYTIIENVLDTGQLSALRSEIDTILAQERKSPWDPTPTHTLANENELRDFFSSSYSASPQEIDRLIHRISHTQSEQLDTEWPVPVAAYNKNFLHLPTLFDDDRSQRIWNLIGKSEHSRALVEHPLVMELVTGILGPDCVLHDCSATSIGSQTAGGAWHVDAPLGQLPEPLPDFPLTTQNAWLLDDFTSQNGATRVVPGSHLTRLKPQWREGDMEEEIILTAPAGSLALWLSNTWHRSGPNTTANPRRAILCYYGRSWTKPFNDFRGGTAPEIAASFSNRLKYLIGYSSNPIVRG
ncbi:MAG: phytanoyl-CoA dioxygenase family protein [Pirellulaceae bacterium]|nr:phytanoyl-CoA dioxygenase family protein [Pirellulaceae bacterium]